MNGSKTPRNPLDKCARGLLESDSAFRRWFEVIFILFEKYCPTVFMLI